MLHVPSPNKQTKILTVHLSYDTTEQLDSPNVRSDLSIENPKPYTRRKGKPRQKACLGWGRPDRDRDELLSVSFSQKGVFPDPGAWHGDSGT